MFKLSLLEGFLVGPVTLANLVKLDLPPIGLPSSDFLLLLSDDWTTSEDNLPASFILDRFLILNVADFGSSFF